MQLKITSLAFFILLLGFSGKTQTWAWANSLGEVNGNTTVKNIRPYAGNDVLICGSFATPTLDLGTFTLSNAGQDDGYVAVMNESGQCNWTSRIGGSGRDFVVDAAAAPGGGIVAAGNFSSLSLTIGGASFFSSGETDAFVAKYNQDGSLAWAKKIGTADIDEISNVVVDAGGNTYVSGHVLDKLTLLTLHVFIRKLDAAGNMLWERKGLIQGGILQATALAIDDDQHIYLGGSLYGTANFNGTNLSCDTSYAAYILKYNPSGTLADTYLNPDLDKVNSLKIHDDQVYLCAESIHGGFGWGWPLSDSKIHTLKLTPNLDTHWHKTAGGENPLQSLDIARSISVDELGNVYVAGYFFSDTLSYAGQVLPNFFNVNYYYPQIFVIKYSPEGDEVWAKSLGGIHWDEATSIHAIGDDKFYLGGYFESNPVNFGAYTLNNTGTLDSIYVHLRPARFGRKTIGFLALFDKDAIVGIRPQPGLGEVSLFPNPIADWLTVKFTIPTRSPLILQLRSADGKLLIQRIHSGPVTDIQEDLSALTPGFYLISLKTDQGMYVGKLLKL